MPYYASSAQSSSTYSKDGAPGPSTSSGGRTSANSEPTYIMEHLATFTVTKETGIVYPADGMRRLLQLEKSNGIWSQKMQLRLERNWVLIMDNETGAVMERFPVAQIQEPTGFMSRDPMEMYNNILVFIVADDSGSGQRAEMHIFQCQSVSAQALVQDLKMLQMGRLVPGDSPRGPRGPIPPPPALPPPEPPLNVVNVRERVSVFNARKNDGLNDVSREENNDEASSTSSEKYERDVMTLNHCFDDIEKFIARLQHAAAASRELERRRRNSKSKKRNLGDGMLTMRAKPPPEMEFIDIFQKFKLSFNLLAKLKAHIHDPNAPELVHFLFTPLALIVDASHDTHFDRNLPSKVVPPLLTREAINLLINCVTSKETELWHSLGPPWLVPLDQWKGDVAPYHPVFMDGWTPEYTIAEDHRVHDNLASLLNADKQKRDEMPEQQNDPYYGHRDVEESHYSDDYLDYEPRDERGNEYFERNYGPGSELFGREDRDQRGEQTRAHSDISVDSIERGPRGASGNDRAQEAWLDDLLARQAKIVQVAYPRTANNDKELTVVRGEYLEILDNNREWWKARNSRGQVAHVPNTIVTYHDATHSGEADAFSNPLYMSKYQRQGRGYNYEDSEIGGTSTSPGPEPVHRQPAIPPPAPVDWVRKERLGKKDCSVSSAFMEGFNDQASSAYAIPRLILRPKTSKMRKPPFSRRCVECPTNFIRSLCCVANRALPPIPSASPSPIQSPLTSKLSPFLLPSESPTTSKPSPSPLRSGSLSSPQNPAPPQNLPPPPPPLPPLPPLPTLPSLRPLPRLPPPPPRRSAASLAKQLVASTSKRASPSSSRTGTMKSINSTKFSCEPLGDCQSRMQAELKWVLFMIEMKKHDNPISDPPKVYLDQHSTPKQVRKWMEYKGFSKKIVKMFQEYNGADLFKLTKRELEQRCGEAEGRKLDRQITLSRNASECTPIRPCELSVFCPERDGNLKSRNKSGTSKKN